VVSTIISMTTVDLDLDESDHSLGDNLEAVFDKAAIHLRVLGAQLESNQLLNFYARFKQAKEGPCNQPKPGFFDFQGKQKWAAWSSLGDMTRKEAMLEYIQGIEELDPNWLIRFDESAGSDKGASSPFGGVAVSSMLKTDADIPDNDKSVFDWVKEGNEGRLKICLKESPTESLKAKDEEGMTLLHWAADRGNLSIVQFLIDKGCHVNSLDKCGQTPLHYAVSCGHNGVVQLLIALGADVTLKDEDGLTSFDLAEDDMKTFFS